MSYKKIIITHSCTSTTLVCKEIFFRDIKKNKNTIYTHIKCEKLSFPGNIASCNKREPSRISLYIRRETVFLTLSASSRRVVECSFNVYVYKFVKRRKAWMWHKKFHIFVSIGEKSSWNEVKKNLPYMYSSLVQKSIYKYIKMKLMFHNIRFYAFSYTFLSVCDSIAWNLHKIWI